MKKRPTRREVLVTGAGLSALALGCGVEESSPDAALEADAGVFDGSAPDPGPDAGEGPPGLPDLGNPEVAARLWQTMSPYVRVSEAHGTRVNLFNPAPVTQRVVVQLMLPSGQLVAKEELYAAMPPQTAHHLELDEFLAEHDIPLPFEGSLWVGTTPAEGPTFMGLQGISFDWYGPAHMASVHGMRDFGNSNHDGVWSDLILPGVFVSPRYATHIALLNASGDGVTEALVAAPSLSVRDAEGEEVYQGTLPSLGPYTSTLIDLRALLDGASLDGGTAQISEPHAGLVAMGLLFDDDNGGIVTADHFFDRHFVVDSTAFDG